MIGPYGSSCRLTDRIAEDLTGRAFEDDSKIDVRIDKVIGDSCVVPYQLALDTIPIALL